MKRKAAKPKKKLTIAWEKPTRFKVPIPADEPQRLAALRNYRVLDTPAEEDFDHLSAMAAHICGTPIALVSMIDSERQWFKARVGFSLTETSREIAFCAHAIMQRDLFVVPDATQDERFADNPLVASGPGIRFYAGAPLITPDGHAIGTLCVLDRVPRQLTADQADALRALSRQVMSHLEMRRKILDLRHELLARGHHETRALRLLRLARHDAHVKGEALRKNGHRLQAGANAIITLAQHGLAAPGANASREALRTIRSKVRALLNLAHEMKRTATPDTIPKPVRLPSNTDRASAV